MLDEASGVLAVMCCVATRTDVPLLATIAAAICTIAVHTIPPASVPVVVPIPHKLVMGILVVTLAAHAATITLVVILAPSAVMTLTGDAARLDLRVYQIPIHVTVEAEVVEVVSRLP